MKTILRADSAYLRKNLMTMHALAGDYHDRAGERTPDADHLMLQFFKHLDSPNCLLIVVEEDGRPAGFLFALAHERMAFLNAAYLGLKNRKDSDTLKRDCLQHFDDWARELKCEEAAFTTMRGPYAHQWAEKSGWEYQFSVFHKRLEPQNG